MRYLIPGILFIVCGVVALTLPEGWTPTPTWLFCLGVGLLGILQGRALMGATRRRRSESGESAESAPTSRASTPPTNAERADAPTSRNAADDELLAGLGVRVDEPNLRKP